MLPLKNKTKKHGCSVSKSTLTWQEKEMHTQTGVQNH